MKKIQAPFFVGICFVLSAGLPALAGWLIAAQMPLDASGREVALALIASASYLCGAAYLLSHYPMMIVRLRMGLMVSSMSIAGVLAAFLVMPAANGTGLIAALYLAVIASMPVLLFGAHNVIWSHGKAKAALKKTSAVA